MKHTGVISMGVKAPIIRQGDNLEDIVYTCVKAALDENGKTFNDGDVIGITESIVARAQGNYVTINDVIESLKKLTNGNKNLFLIEPIMSRNRFSLILRAFARYADSIVVYHDDYLDEQGNPTIDVNPFTGINVSDYYRQICEEENCEYNHMVQYMPGKAFTDDFVIINARCHPNSYELELTLKDIMTEPINDSGYNRDWGLLGSNKADEEVLKLFPRKDEAQQLVEAIQQRILKEDDKHVHVLINGDGCFHSPKIEGFFGSSINEWADPVTCPAYTAGLDGTPNELKLKAFADGKYKHLNGKELEDAIKEEIRLSQKEELVGSMTSQGTTPRRYYDLLASLFDLLTGSGSKGTPITYCANYFSNYGDN